MSTNVNESDLTPEMLLGEIKALLKKYRAEITVKESYRGHSLCVDGIEIEMDAIWDDDGETLRPFLTLSIPQTIYAE